MKNRIINKWMLSALLVAGLASCEMKDELSGGSDSGATGMLELGLSVQEPVATRADKGTDVSTFAVEIVCTDNPDNNKTFSSFGEIENPVILPVGTYTVTAHSPGELSPIMLSPFYQGDKPLTIKENGSEQVEVVCKMANTKITLKLPDDFLSYQEWQITFDDGTENTLTFSKDGTYDGTLPVYWNLGTTGTSTIRMNITGKTAAGVDFYSTSTFKKADAAESYEDDDVNFVGGDGLVINVKVNDEPVITPEPGDDQSAVNFRVTVDLTFSNSNESVDLPVTPGTGDDNEEEETPDTPGTSNNISIGDNGTGYLTNGVTNSAGSLPTDIAVVMNVPNGIKNVYVQVDSDNSDFLSAVGIFGLATAPGMDLASEAASGLGSLFSLPEPNADEYTFSMNETLCNLLGGFSGTHDFMLTVVDADGNKKSATLTITIN